MTACLLLLPSAVPLAVPARGSQDAAASDSPFLLIVEDDTDLAFGHEALVTVRPTGSDVLLDWRLSGKTEAEMLREAREEGVDAPTIMVSVHPERKLRQKGGAPGPGPTSTFPNPFDLEALEDRVDALLE